MDIWNLNKKRLLIFVGLVLVIVFVGVLLTQRLGKSNIKTFTYEGPKYKADLEIERAINKLNGDIKKARKITDIDTVDKRIALTFEGLTDARTMKKILILLDEHKMKATFFVPGIKSAEDKDIVLNIKRAGHEIGSYSLSGKKHMEKLPKKDIIKDLSLTNVILREITGKEPDILKCNGTEYTDGFLQVAKATGIESVVESNQFLNFQSFSSYDMARSYVKGLKKGSIISIKLEGVLDEEEYKPKNKVKKEAEPAIDKKAGIRKDNVIREEVDIVQTVEWLLKAISENDYSTEFVKDFPAYHDPDINRDYEELRHRKNAKLAMINKGVSTTRNLAEESKTPKDQIRAKESEQTRDYQKLRIENKGKKAEIVTNLYTTQPAVAYVFRGVSDGDVLERVLTVLDGLDAKGSFFVTGKEILNYPENVQEIINRGHQIYNGGYGMDFSNPSSLDFNSMAHEIEMGENVLKSFLGDAYTEEVNSCYMPLYADTHGNVLEAASALGYEKVVTYNRNPMTKEYKNLSAHEIVSDYLSEMTALHRGDIVYFRLDYLSQPGAIEKLVGEIAQSYIKSSTYDIVYVHDLIANDLVYEPMARGEGLGSDLVKITNEYTEEYLLNHIFNRYIGNRSISTTNELIGFTDEEIEKIDKVGEIDTHGEKVIFLTFDDWGSDRAVTKLLNVLKKHNTQSTFFIRVGNRNMALQDSMVNPNLLRAIALEGHDIGNHTFSHIKVNIESEKEESLLREDIVAAHREMARYIGDTGALKLFFRPPTLAVSKLGLKTIFDSGYQYIINGDFSTHDYKAKSTEELMDKFINGMGDRRIEPGTIVVMHMSDNSKFTAEALDIIIPYYQDKGYRFERLSDYLKY